MSRPDLLRCAMEPRVPSGRHKGIDDNDGHVSPWKLSALSTLQVNQVKVGQLSLDSTKNMWKLART